MPPLMEMWECVLLSHRGQTEGCEMRGHGYLLYEHPGRCSLTGQKAVGEELVGIFWFGDEGFEAWGQGSQDVSME